MAGLLAVLLQLRVDLAARARLSEMHLCCSSTLHAYGVFLSGSVPLCFKHDTLYRGGSAGSMPFSVSSLLFTTLLYLRTRITPYSYLPYHASGHVFDQYDCNDSFCTLFPFQSRSLPSGPSTTNPDPD